MSHKMLRPFIVKVSVLGYFHLINIVINILIIINSTLLIYIYIYIYIYINNYITIHY